MLQFHSVLKHSIFARWFAKVPAFFWPVLYWQMGRHLRWMKDTGYMDLLFQVHWWGGITIVYKGDKSPGSSVYRAYVNALPEWNDPVWAPRCLQL